MGTMKLALRTPIAVPPCQARLFRISAILCAALAALPILFTATRAQVGSAPAVVRAPAPETAAADLHLAALDAERRALRALSFRAEIATPKAGGRWGRSTLNFSWQAPRSWKSELIMGIEGRLVTIADGQRIWQHETRTRRVYVQDQDRALTQLRTHGPVDPISALASPQIALAELFRVTASEDSGPNRILTLVPRRAVPGYDLLRLALTRDGKTPVWAESVRAGRLSARVTFREWRRNPDLSVDLFRFTPPNGVAPTVIP